MIIQDSFFSSPKMMGRNTNIGEMSLDIRNKLPKRSATELHNEKSYFINDKRF